MRLLEAADDELLDEITRVLRTYRDNVVERLMPALRLAHARRAPGLDAGRRKGVNVISRSCEFGRDRIAPAVSL